MKLVKINKVRATQLYNEGKPVLFNPEGEKLNNTLGTPYQMQKREGIPMSELMAEFKSVFKCARIDFYRNVVMMFLLSLIVSCGSYDGAIYENRETIHVIDDRDYQGDYLECYKLGTDFDEPDFYMCPNGYLINTKSDTIGSINDYCLIIERGLNIKKYLCFGGTED